MTIIVLLATVGSALMSGLFFAFSTSVMPGLRDLPADQARAAMRRMNVRIQNPLFLLIFVGTAVLGVISAFAGEIIAGALYVAGAFLLTMLINVPMNNRLEKTDDEYWPAYLRQWTLWNHVRALACTASVVMYVI